MKVNIPDYNANNMKNCYDFISKNQEEANKKIEDFINDKFMQIMKPKDTYRKLLAMKSCATTEFEKTVINKLIGDKKLLKKIAFVSDGSFINNRIAMWNDSEDGFRMNFIEFISMDLVYSPLPGYACKYPEENYGYSKEDFKKFREKFKELPIKKKINTIFNSFDHIFIHQMITTDTRDTCIPNYSKCDDVCSC